jgi:hypothetical protein
MDKRSTRYWAIKDNIPVRTACNWINYAMKEKNMEFEKAVCGYLLSHDEWRGVKKWAKERKTK